MSLVIAVILNIYLCVFLKEVIFEYPIVVLSLHLLVLLLSIKRDRLALFVISSALSFALMMNADYASRVDLSIDKSDVEAIYLRVLSSESIKKGRKGTFKGEVYAVEDKAGSLFSSKGVIYVFSDSIGTTFGDSLYLKGSFDGELFFAKSGALIERGPFSRLRRLFASIVKERSRGSSLSLMLLMGINDSRSGLIERARNGGLSHIIALSGMHLSFISLLLKPLLFFAKGKRKKVLKFSILLVFVYLSSWKPSLLRSFLFMLFISVFPYGVSYYLSFALLIILFPSALSDMGFVLSFLSFGAILLISSAIADFLERILPIRRKALSILSASISALFVSIPVVLKVFGSYRLIGIITSFLASALIEIALLLSILSLALPSIFKPVLIYYEAFIMRSFSLFSMGSPIESIFPYIVFALLTLFSLLYEGIARIRIGKKRLKHYHFL